jgi:hypothetical protein
MRRCFVCNSDKVCSHRELELLPPNAKRRAIRELLKKHTEISQFELDQIRADSPQDQQHTFVSVEAVEITGIKPVGDCE